MDALRHTQSLPKLNTLDLCLVIQCFLRGCSSIAWSDLAPFQNPPLPPCERKWAFDLPSPFPHTLIVWYLNNIFAYAWPTSHVHKSLFFVGVVELGEGQFVFWSVYHAMKNDVTTHWSNNQSRVQKLKFSNSCCGRGGFWQHSEGGGGDPMKSDIFWRWGEGWGRRGKEQRNKMLTS